MFIQFIFGFLLFFFVCCTHSYLTLSDRLFYTVDVDVCVLSFLHTFRSPSYLKLVIIGVVFICEKLEKHFKQKGSFDRQYTQASLCEKSQSVPLSSIKKSASLNQSLVEILLLFFISAFSSFLVVFLFCSWWKIKINPLTPGRISSSLSLPFSKAVYSNKKKSAHFSCSLRKRMKCNMFSISHVSS